MFCSISGNAPESPVVSKITGHVYEKSLLEKYLVAEGKVCPPFSFFSVPLAAGSCSVRSGRAVRPVALRQQPPQLLELRDSLLWAAVVCGRWRWRCSAR